MTMTRKRIPTHPGAVLREIALPAMRVSVSQAVREMGISRQSLHRILAGERGVTPEMAVRVGKYCGNGPGVWLRMQAAYDLWYAEKSLASQIKEIPTHVAV